MFKQIILIQGWYISCAIALKEMSSDLTHDKSTLTWTMTCAARQPFAHGHFGQTLRVTDVQLYGDFYNVLMCQRCAYIYIYMYIYIYISYICCVNEIMNWISVLYVNFHCLKAIEPYVNIISMAQNDISYICCVNEIMNWISVLYVNFHCLKAIESYVNIISMTQNEVLK